MNDANAIGLVIGALAVVVPLAVSIIKPIVNLTKAITGLTVKLDDVKVEVDTNEKHNHESHKRIWEHNEMQDKQLADHDARIRVLENNED